MSELYQIHQNKVFQLPHNRNEICVELYASVGVFKPKGEKHNIMVFRIHNFSDTEHVAIQAIKLTPTYRVDRVSSNSCKTAKAAYLGNVIIPVEQGSSNISIDDTEVTLSRIYMIDDLFKNPICISQVISPSETDKFGIRLAWTYLHETITPTIFTDLGTIVFKETVSLEASG